MNDFDIPIFKKTYELYQTMYGYRRAVPKQDRYAIWQRSENLVLDVLEGIMLASQSQRAEKLQALERVSVKLNMVRVFLRLMKEIRTFDAKHYVNLQGFVDEIGRMLGGWIRATRQA